MATCQTVDYVCSPHTFPEQDGIARLFVGGLSLSVLSFLLTTLYIIAVCYDSGGIELTSVRQVLALIVAVAWSVVPIIGYLIRLKRCRTLPSRQQRAASGEIHMYRVAVRGTCRELASLIYQHPAQHSLEWRLWPSPSGTVLEISVVGCAGIACILTWRFGPSVTFLGAWLIMGAIPLAKLAAMALGLRRPRHVAIDGGCLVSRQNGLVIQSMSLIDDTDIVVCLDQNCIYGIRKGFQVFYISLAGVLQIHELVAALLFEMRRVGRVSADCLDANGVTCWRS